MGMRRVVGGRPRVVGVGRGRVRCRLVRRWRRHGATPMVGGRAGRKKGGGLPSRKSTGGQAGDGVIRRVVRRRGAVGVGGTVVSRARVDDGRVVEVEQLHVLLAVALENVTGSISEE